MDHGLFTQQLPDGSRAPNLLAVGTAIPHDDLGPSRDGQASILAPIACNAVPVRSLPHKSPLLPREVVQCSPRGHLRSKMRLIGLKHIPIPFLGDHEPKLQPRVSEDSQESFHTEIRMTDGTMGVVVDPGSVFNLSRDEWAVEIAKAAAKAGRLPKQKKRRRPLTVAWGR